MFELSGFNFHILEVIIVPFVIILMSTLPFFQVKVISKKQLNVYILFVFLFLASIVISLFNAINQQAIFFRAIPKWIEIFGLSLFVFLFCSSKKKFKHIWWILILSIILNAIGIFYLDFWKPYLSGEFSSWQKSQILLMAFRRISGNDFLLILAFILPFWRKNFVIKTISLFVITLIIISLSRGAIFALIIVYTYWIWQEKKNLSVFRQSIFIFVVIVIIFLTMLAIFPESLIMRISEINDFSLRKALLINTIYIFINNVFTGVGAENFAEYLLQSGKFPDSHGITENLAPHNLWLQIAAENGILGILALIGWFFTIYMILWKHNSLSIELQYLLGLKLFFIAEIAILTFGYISGGERLQLSLFAGLTLASLRVFSKNNKFSAITLS